MHLWSQHRKSSSTSTSNKDHIYTKKKKKRMYLYGTTRNAKSDPENQSSSKHLFSSCFLFYILFIHLLPHPFISLLAA